MDLQLRVYDKRNQRWIHPDLLIITNYGVYKDFRSFDNDLELIDYDLMLNTGITDRYNQLIFDGDILKVFPISAYCEVVYKIPSFCVRWITKKIRDIRGEYEPLDNQLTYEVIGNRYDQNLMGELN